MPYKDGVIGQGKRRASSCKPQERANALFQDVANGYDDEIPVGASLLAIAVNQAKLCQLTHRYREQARS
ncbi:hypothetical protein, partial [Pseudomonas sp.]|uniref:hypothetical protein n=1 Tax=Pseudomonas sp. TaxID=306 RepID=UPI003F2F4AA8